MATNEHIIKAPGMMKNLAVGGHLTTADQVLDDSLNKDQKVINQERIAAEELLRQAYEALTQSDIVVGDLPASGEVATIYRVPGESSYKDYMWDGTQFVEMAEYDNAIDDNPTPNSNNLVKSGGVDAAVAKLGLTNKRVINEYIAELYIADSTWTLNQVDFAIAYYVSTGEYQGKYMNVLRLRFNIGNRSFIDPTYYDTEAAALTAWENAVTSKIMLYHGTTQMVGAFTEKEFASTTLIAGVPINAELHDIETMPRIKSYFLQNQVDAIPKELGTEISNDIVFNRYVKEIVYNNRNASTTYVKIAFAIGNYDEQAQKYKNVLRINEYNSDDERVEFTEFFNDSFDTLEEALNGIRTGVLTKYNSYALLSTCEFTETHPVINFYPNHPLTYEYSPRLTNNVQEEIIDNLRMQYLYNKTTVINPPYSIAFKEDTTILKEGESYEVFVELQEARETDTIIYIRYYPEGVTTTLKKLTIPAGETSLKVTIIPKMTIGHRCIIVNDGESEFDAHVILSFASTEYNVDKSLKVLFVGSSYGVNTISMFPVLAHKAGIDIICGSLYYGSASIGVVDIRPLAHIPSKFANNTDFGWYKKFIGGAWESGVGEEGYRTYQYALEDEEWDIIIFQRGAEELKINVPWSDMQTSCLQQMIEYTRNNCNYEPAILFADGLANPVGYGGYQTRESQNEQTRHIIETSQIMKSKFGIDVIPVGVALQNARNTVLHNYGYNNGLENHDLASDTQHLDAGLGYYVTGATLFEFIIKPLFGTSIINLDYLPRVTDVKDCWVNSTFVPPGESNSRRHTDAEMFTGITRNNLNIAKYAVLDAIATPTQISETLPQRWGHRYSVEFDIVDCVSSFENSQCETTFFTLITPNEGKVLGTPVITMGEDDVTDQVYSTISYDDVVFGKVNIPVVTGNINIQIAAV